MLESLPPDQKKLLRNKKVLEEIHRHLWIESEKAGQDIGFENAALDWLERFSKSWMNYHMPTTPKEPSAKLKALWSLKLKKSSKHQ